MLKKILKLGFLLSLLLPSLSNAQFRTKDRMDYLEGFDDKKFNWGFYLVGDYFDYKMSLKKDEPMDYSKASAGFGAGLIGKMRVNNYVDLRLEPAMQFVQREVKAEKLKATYLDIPLFVEFHGDRWYNSRPYVALGGNLLMNLQAKNSAVNTSPTSFIATSMNYGWSAEAGIQFYFDRFKLTPGFRGTFITNNELDNPKWNPNVSKMQTRAFMFVLKFE